MSQHLDSFAEAFIDLCYPGIKTLEAGAAFGVCTIPVLEAGAEVIVNDLSKDHLKTIWEDCPIHLKNRLVLAPGPIQNLKYEPETFDAIFTSRMLHLLTGEDVEATLRNFYQWLKPEGTLIAIVDTPFLRSYAGNLSNYELKCSKGDKWPGMIADTTSYKEILHNNIPEFINFIDLPTLERVTAEAGFIIEKSEYINQTTFPPELRLDGRESAGIMAVKPA